MIWFRLVLQNRGEQRIALHLVFYTAVLSNVQVHGCPLKVLGLGIDLLTLLHEGS